MALHDLIEHCGYPASIKNELIHDRLVVGIRDTKLSQTLQMDAFLMLERAKRQICQKEAIGEQQHTLKREVEVKPGGSRSNSTELDTVTTRCVHQLQCRHLSRNSSGSSFTGRTPPPSVDELLDSNSYREDTRETSVEREGARYTSDEGDMVVGSMDLEQFGGSDDDVREESRGAVVSPITAITGSEHAEQNRESSPAAVTLRSEREGPLVPNPQRIRFGSRSDRRQRNRGGADTDEETDVVLSQRNSLASPDHEIDRELERERERAKEQDRDQPSAKSKGSKKKSVSKGLLKSPGLKFITRPDLYSFLNTAGVSTEEMRAVPYSRLSLLSSFLLTGSW